MSSRFHRSGFRAIEWRCFLLCLLVLTTGCNVVVAVDEPMDVSAVVSPTSIIRSASPTAIDPSPTPISVASPTASPLALDLPIQPTMTRALPTEPTSTPSAPEVVSSTTHLPPDRIIAPSIGLDVPVAPVGWSVVEEDGVMRAEWQVPLDVAGWHQNSAVPGEDGNVVLSGHHNLGAEVFRHLIELQIGDEIVVDTGGEPHRYAVTDRFVVPERGVSEAQQQQNALWIAPTKRERLTLVTCWPYTDNSHRVIVVAAPVESSTELEYGG